MNKEYQEVLAKTAEYVQNTQLELDKVAEARDHWNHQAVKTAAVLADRGILDPAKVDGFTDKIAEDPSYALVFMEKIAKMVEANSLGRPSEVTKIAADEVDGFTRELFPELISNNGLID